MYDSSDRSQVDARLEVILAEYLRAVENGQAVDREGLLAQHPEFAGELQAFFANHAAVERVAAPLRAAGDEPTVGLASSGGAANRLQYVGDYELLGEIARGGMGVVYRARQLSLNRVVAVKMILAGQLADESAIRRFRQEAEAAASLDHPHIVPIYEVAEHGGQQYFSMGLVEGSSLATRVAAGPMPAREAAELVRTVAAAVQFAHDRGVIHRDLKPANILLDAQGRPRVTDFGLAKRTSDGQSLTETGQVLGTPSYMPPEQVQAKEIGPAADVYALGAILYALLTGRPPFVAATAMETMLQVLAADPVSPRQLIPGLPRDLDTIVLKCLEKRPQWRYATAAELVAELDRYLAGEPIRARRPGVVEQGLRWLARQQRSVALGIGVAVGTAALVIGGIAGTAVYQKSREGTISLDTQHPRLVADVRTPSGEKVLPAFTAPTQQPLSLPAGDYVVRAGGKDFLSEDFHVRIERGQQQQLNLSLDSQTLWPTEKVLGAPLLLPETVATAAALLDLHDDGVRLLAPSLKQELWSRKFQPLDDPKLKAIPSFAWKWSYWEAGTSGQGLRNYRPHVVLPAPKLNDDQLGDIVLACRHQPALIALDANNGQVLWAYAPQELADVVKKLEQRRASGAWLRNGAIIGPPLVLPDIDGDGVVDFVISAMLVSADLMTDKPQPVRVLDAVSGKTGKRLWSYSLPEEWFALLNVSELPRGATWLARGNGTGGGSHIMHPFANTFRESSRQIPFGDTIAVPYPLKTMRVGGADFVSCIAGSRLLFLDPKTGQEKWPPQTPTFFPHIEPRVVSRGADADDALLLAQEIEVARLNSNPYQGHGLTLWSPAQNTPIWEQAVFLGKHDKDIRAYQPLPRWPVVVDLNGDGVDEIITADGTSLDRPNGFALAESTRAWGGLVLLGKTPKDPPVWKCRLETVDQQVDQFIVGPDINGDGWRDLFAANIFARGYGSGHVYVDAISGQTGEILWSQGSPVNRHGRSQIEDEVVYELRWWNESQLIVAVRDGSERDRGRSAGLFVFAAADGKLLRQSSDLLLHQVVDGDGDGLEDLFCFQPTPWAQLDGAHAMEADQGGQLISIRGTQPAAWKHSGGAWQAGDDYNGDGQADAISQKVEYVAGQQLVTTRDGRDGQVLYRAATSGGIWVGAAVVPLHADLNGDQVADFVTLDANRGSSSALGTPAIHAFSGKSGRELWEPTVNARSMKHTLLLEARDLDQDGRCELIHIAEFDLPSATTAAPASDPPLWLIVIDGSTGKLRWQQKLNDRSSQTGRAQSLALATSDLNRDGTLDVIVPAVIFKNQYPELRAFDGKTGEPLLSDLALPGNGGFGVIDNLPIPVAGDIDGDGQPEILVQDYFRPDELKIRDLAAGTRLELPANAPAEAKHLTSRLICLTLEGKTRWIYDAPTGGTEPQTIDGIPLPHFRSRPLLVARGGNLPPAICIWLWGIDWRTPEGKLIVLDNQGQELWQHPVRTRMGNRHFRVWNLDVNRDGREELLVVDHEGMFALDIETRTPLWQQKFPTMNSTPLGTFPGNDKIPPHLAVVAGQQVRALGGATGETVWNCSGLPQPHYLLESPRDTQLLANDSGLPRVLWSKGNETVCFATAADAQAQSTPSPTQRDPRFSRPFPWIAAGEDPVSPFGKPLVLLMGLFYTFAFALFPGYLFWQMAWQRRWSLGFFLLIPVAVGLALYAWQLPIESRGMRSALQMKVQLVLLELPAAIGLLLIARWLLQGKWRPPLIYSVLLIVWSTVLISVWIALDQRNSSPLEYYLWDRWWVVLVMAVYSTAVLVTVATIIALPLRWMWRAT